MGPPRVRPGWGTGARPGASTPLPAAPPRAPRGRRVADDLIPRGHRPCPRPVTRSGPAEADRLRCHGLEVDRLVHEDRVLPRSATPGVLGVDVHDRSLAPDGAR